MSGADTNPLIVANRAAIFARTAINMNLTLAWIMAEAGVMRPAAVDALGRAVTKGFEGFEIDPALPGHIELLKLSAELEQMTGAALVGIRQQAEKSWVGNGPTGEG